MFRCGQRTAPFALGIMLTVASVLSEKVCAQEVQPSPAPTAHQDPTFAYCAKRGETLARLDYYDWDSAITAEALLITGNCLFQNQSYSIALKAYGYVLKPLEGTTYLADPRQRFFAAWHRAVIEDRLNIHNDAILDIQEADAEQRISTGDNTDDLDTDASQAKAAFAADYARINAAQIARDKQAVKDEKEVAELEQVTFWDALSADQKTVVHDHGGWRKNNVNARPCHVSTFNGGTNYQQETWWYCDDNGQYEQSYTFLNGHLESTFTP